MRKLYIISTLFWLFAGCDQPKDNSHSEIEPLYYLEGSYLEGYFLDTTAISNEMPNFLEDTLGSFVYRINRDYYLPSDRLRRLTEKAESLFPPVDTIMASYGFNAFEIPQDESMWWSQTFDGVRIPYAITWSSVEYYRSLLNLYEQGLFEEAQTISMSSASLIYETEIEYYRSFQVLDISYQSVWVVSQTLEWDNYCGSLCAMSFRAKRMVIFDYDTEQLIAVIGDGTPLVMVS